MRAKSKRTKKKINKKRLLLNGIILSISICAVLALTNKLPIFIDRVMAGEMIEEVGDTIDDNTSSNKAEENSVGEQDNTNGQKSSNEQNSSNDQGSMNNGSADKKLIEDTDDILIVVNKKRYLPSDYKPSDLVVPNVKFSFNGEYEKKYMRHEAANALEELFDQAKEEGIYLYAVSGYRSYNTQERLFNNYSSKHGEEEANKFSARPGESEHQTGLAMDVSSQSAGFGLNEEFGNTVEGKWVRDNAHKFGFIIRYLKEKTDITGYTYEPWHIRYVGKDIAEKIYNEGITLEEYFELQ